VARQTKTGKVDEWRQEKTTGDVEITGRHAGAT